MRKQSDFEAYLDDYTGIHLYQKKYQGFGNDVFFFMEDETGNQYDIEILHTYEDGDYLVYEATFAHAIVFGYAYTVVNQSGRETPLVFAGIVKTPLFDEQFSYEGSDLGYTYTEEYTEFKVWAPSAYDLKLEFFPSKTTYQMERQAKGVYYVRVEGDLKQQRYQYIVSVNGLVHRALDPYTKAVDVNERHNVIVDVKHPEISEANLPKMQSNCDAIIYELSIRDVTAGKTYQSFLEAGEADTGFAYVKTLGITHLQIMPTFAFRGVNEQKPLQSYNWGYDVTMWMALENAYGSNPEDAKQTIQELQTLVYKCHEAGIRVNLDVVYNHVFERETSSLDQLVPYYYFQLQADYQFSNATMCGNDVDTKRKMAAKLVVDSCMYVLEMFDIDGLRFDLMGILDIATLNEVARRARAKKADFMIYGEGWNMPSVLAPEERASMQNNDKMLDVAYFSDVFRDTIKGHQSGNYLEHGYVLGNTSLLFKAMNVLCASVGDFGYQKVFQRVDQVINYVECHDNMTSWDQIDRAMNESEEDKIKRHKMMLAFVLLAQGIPFLHSGQEFLRTKQGYDNTYNSGDAINHLDYTRKDKYSEVVAYTKQLIALRKQYRLFRKDDVEDVYQTIYYEHIDQKVLCYILKDETMKVQVIFNPTQETFHRELEKEWEIIFLNGTVTRATIKSFDICPLDVIILMEYKEEI